MTSEQIAELRELDTLPPGLERRLAVYEAAVNFMPRLLDEREALLVALRRFATFAGESLERRSCNSMDLEREWHAAHAAIARAESP